MTGPDNSPVFIEGEPVESTQGCLAVTLWQSGPNYAISHAPTGEAITRHPMTAGEAETAAVVFWSRLSEAQREAWRQAKQGRPLRKITPTAAISVATGVAPDIVSAILGFYVPETNDKRLEMSEKNENRSAEMVEYQEALKKAGYAVVYGNRGATPLPELEAAWAKVQHGENWKYPVDATIPVIDLCTAVEAIAHYTGSETYVGPAGPGLVRIYAPGYYQTIGA